MIDKTIIQLTMAEIQMASVIGVQRQIEDIKNNKASVDGELQETAWQRHLEGALTECALAKHLNVYWSKGRYDQPDVGNQDVRATHREDGRLILRDRDKDDRKYWLLTGINGKYTIQGWILGKDGKKEKYWGDPSGRNRPAYFVPQEALNKPHFLD
jgi:hypothetical protein